MFVIKKIIPIQVKYALKRLFDFLRWDPWLVRSWSQEGEDMILHRIFYGKKNGFYVDIGAHHPKRFSNTYFFYRHGWRGINIDAMPGSMKLFNKWRPKDINLEIGVAEETGILNYYVFNETALNSFSKEVSEQRDLVESNYYIKEVIQVKVAPLSEILDRYNVPNNIDFFSIDVEGYDLSVIKSNDWSKYRPTIVLVEILDSSMHKIEQSDIGRFMSEIGYVVYGKCVHTVLFRKVEK
jgi:hypothetical protein